MAPILQTATDLMARGGWVMWPLLAMSVLAVALSVERLAFWAGTHRPGRGRWLARLADKLRAGDRASAGAICEDDRSVYGRFVRGLLDRGADDAAASELAEQVRPSIERFAPVLSTIITAAPLLGILGTVTGIIDSFRLLGGPTDAPVTDPGAVAAGIAEALITTAFGLVVAVLTLFPYAHFRASAGRAFGRLESLASAAQQGARAGGRSPG